MSFNENSAMPEQLQGHTEVQDRSDTPLNPGQPETPSVPVGTTALAWWDSMKYYWKTNARGNGAHLAPQEDYLASVLHRAEYYIDSIEKHEIGTDDLEEFAATAELRQSLIQNEDAVDTSGIEGNSVRREVLNRYIIAYKICGTTAVSAEHRVTNELSRENGDVEKMKEDPKGYFASDVEKRQRWGFKALRLRSILSTIADGEVIPNTPVALKELVEKRVRGSIYSDAVDRGNALKKPVQTATASTSKPSVEELLALTA